MYNKTIIYESDYNNNNYKKDFRHSLYVNKLLNNNNYKDLNKNIKSRNKNEYNFKNKEIEAEKNNNEDLIHYQKYINGKSSKTIYCGLVRNDKNFNNRNGLIHHKSKTNFFREKASKKHHNSKEKRSNNNDYYTYHDSDKNDNNIDNMDYILKLLNTKNQSECIYKINKLLSYEDFIHKIKKIYSYNENKKTFTLKDILFWISMNYNNRKKNKYEEFCHGIMQKFNISNFDNFKIFFRNLITKDKNSDYFVNEMKELFNNFNDFRPNKTIYRNRSSQKTLITSDNEDDINNII